MRFGTTRSQMYDAQKTARAKWDASGDHWADQARRDHEEAVVEPLDRGVSDALRAIDQLAVLFTQIRTECEYPGQL
ncbi:MAG TPA: hypothetical protein VGI99_09180 [Gemmataceae bacterium]|jgi:hypothetical protein